MKRLFLALAACTILASITSLAAAHEQGEWILRAGVGVVDPKSTSYSDPVEDVAVKIDTGTSLAVTGAYMMTDNWAFEVLAAWPFNHKINLVSGGQKAKLGETDHLPPTFSVQYFFPIGGSFQPYFGLGLNWTTFFNTDLVPELASAGVTLDLDDSFGVAAQIGADMMLNDRWMLNVDFRWINIETDATLFDGVDTTTINVKIDPIVYGVTVGYRF